MGSFKAVSYADLLIIVLRCFEGTEITHYLETIDPLRDFKMIEQELLQMVLSHLFVFSVFVSIFSFFMFSSIFLRFQFSVFTSGWYMSLVGSQSSGDSAQ